MDDNEMKRKMLKRLEKEMGDYQVKSRTPTRSGTGSIRQSNNPARPAREPAQRARPSLSGPYRSYGEMKDKGRGESDQDRRNRWRKKNYENGVNAKKSGKELAAKVSGKQSLSPNRNRIDSSILKRKDTTEDNKKKLRYLSNWGGFTK